MFDMPSEEADHLLIDKDYAEDKLDKSSLQRLRAG
jgi:hypothetical protein